MFDEETLCLAIEQKNFTFDFCFFEKNQTISGE